jgi:hypothetical protein
MLLLYQTLWDASALPTYCCGMHQLYQILWDALALPNIMGIVQLLKSYVVSHNLNYHPVTLIGM